MSVYLKKKEKCAIRRSGQLCGINQVHVIEKMGLANCGQLSRVYCSMVFSNFHSNFNVRTYLCCNRFSSNCLKNSYKILQASFCICSITKCQMFQKLNKPFFTIFDVLAEELDHSLFHDSFSSIKTDLSVILMK